MQVRQDCPRCRILGFEIQKGLFDELHEALKGDERTRVFNYGLSNVSTQLQVGGRWRLGVSKGFYSAQVVAGNKCCEWQAGRAGGVASFGSSFCSPLCTSSVV